MMKRAVATALAALAIGVAYHHPASAGGAHGKYSETPPSNVVGEPPMPARSDRCWWDVPVIGAGVAFFELLRDEESVNSCPDFQDQRTDHPEYRRRDGW